MTAQNLAEKTLRELFKLADVPLLTPGSSSLADALGLVCARLCGFLSRNSAVPCPFRIWERRMQKPQCRPRAERAPCASVCRLVVQSELAVLRKEADEQRALVTSLQAAAVTQVGNR